MAEPACLLIHNSNIDLESRQYWLQVKRCDLTVKKPSRPLSHSPGIKQNIFEFSAHSRARLLSVCRNSGHLIKSQFLLSYPAVFPQDGLTVKKHLNQFLVELRKEFGGSEVCHYLWCLEFQERGAPHIHFFSSLDVNDSTRQWLASSWVRIIGGGPGALTFHSHRNNFFTWDMQSGSYLSKQYLAKSVQKTVPEKYKNVGRFWGNSKTMKPKSIIINPDDYETTDIARLQSAVRILTKQFEKGTIKRKKEAQALQRSKTMAKGKTPKISKRNRRKTIRSYTMPLLTGAFFTAVQHLSGIDTIIRQLMT